MERATTNNLEVLGEAVMDFNFIERKDQFPLGTLTTEGNAWKLKGPARFVINKSNGNLIMMCALKPYSTAVFSKDEFTYDLEGHKHIFKLKKEKE